MTGHNREEREALIEEAAKALFAGGDGLESSPETRAIWEPRIRAALAVFEQAHAPTSDEREGLRDAFDEMHRITEGGCDTRGEDVADMVIALGFRRTVQGEPTDAQVSAALLGYFPEVKEQKELQRWGKRTRERMRAALRAAAKVQEGER